MAELRASLPGLPGTRLGEETVSAADDFAYDDPVDGSAASARASASCSPVGARIVYRLSGTGTAGATLRVYLERYEPDRLDEDTQAFLAR